VHSFVHSVFRKPTRFSRTSRHFQRVCSSGVRDPLHLFELVSLHLRCTDMLINDMQFIFAAVLTDCTGLIVWSVLFRSITGAV
jgi:hypothetical protein